MDALSAPDGSWLQSHALVLEHSEMLAPLDDLVALGPVFANIQVVYLGESTHDDGGATTARLRLA